MGVRWWWAAGVVKHGACLLAVAAALQDSLWELFLEALCNPGHVGEMYTSAAPYDPLFWVVHPTGASL